MKLQDICGNEHAKRAIEVALAGNFSVQFIGPWDSEAGVLAEYARQHQLKSRAIPACPCGFWGDAARECTCSLQMAAGWRSKHFGERENYDLTIEVAPCDVHKIIGMLSGKLSEPEEAVLKRVDGATRHTDMHLDEAGVALLKAAIQQIRLDYRRALRIVEIARTIANLAHAERIHVAHLAEAIQYRPRRNNQ
ncbi:MAG: hypothetical protein A2W25_12275 [candidate division Zixibacteria bacterium RBG_16_53_22]|nr:MAG: hypothetical protein A2W25_12275 [candidate division Zixibacteria bacterium RBG_16_53_22]